MCKEVGGGGGGGGEVKVKEDSGQLHGRGSGRR